MIGLIMTGLRYCKVMPDEKEFNLAYLESRYRNCLNAMKQQSVWFMLVLAWFAFLQRGSEKILAVCVLTVAAYWLTFFAICAKNGCLARKPLTHAEDNLYAELCSDRGIAPKLDAVRFDLVEEMNLALKRGNRGFLEKF